MLTVDANKRITMEQIINHVWMRSEDDMNFLHIINSNNVPPVPDVDLLELNEHILNHMESLQIDRQRTIKVIVSDEGTIFF